MVSPEDGKSGIKKTVLLITDHPRKFEGEFRSFRVPLKTELLSSATSIYHPVLKIELKKTTHIWTFSTLLYYKYNFYSNFTGSRSYQTKSNTCYWCESKINRLWLLIVTQTGSCHSTPLKTQSQSDSNEKFHFKPTAPQNTQRVGQVGNISRCMAAPMVWGTKQSRVLSPGPYLEE